MSTLAPQLEVVFFDVDDTLYSTTAFSKAARRSAVAAMIDAGLRIGFDEGVAELDEVVAEFTSNYPYHFPRLLDRLGPEAADGKNPAVLVAAGVVAYHRSKERGMRILSDVHDLLERMFRARVRMGVISAGLQVKQAEKLIRLDALKYFDPAAIFFSDQVGVSKPNPKIYIKACAHVGIWPERALYVGDRPTHDVAPAHAAGMKTVHYTGAEGKYAAEVCATEPDHRVADMRDLTPLLRETYGLRL